MTLLRAVMSIGRNAGGIIPNGMSLDFESAADGDTKNHMSLIDWCEKTASKIIVGGTLLSQADGKTSTNAQSNTHELQFEKIIKSDAKQLARSLTDYLVSSLMRLNYPNIQPDRYPSFSLIRLILKTCRSLVNHSKSLLVWECESHCHGHMRS